MDVCVCVRVCSNSAELRPLCVSPARGKACGEPMKRTCEWGMVE